MAGVLVLILVVTVIGCGSDSGPAYEGEIIAVSSDNAHITLCSDQGPVEILLIAGRDYGFSLAHLQDHLTSGDPVRVTVRSDDASITALTISDSDADPNGC